MTQALYAHMNNKRKKKRNFKNKNVKFLPMHSVAQWMGEALSQSHDIVSCV
jgi:hypothetical protein